MIDPAHDDDPSRLPVSGAPGIDTTNDADANIDAEILRLMVTMGVRPDVAALSTYVLPDLTPAGPEPDERRGPATAPDRAAAVRALRTLLDYGASHAREAYEHVVDAISEAAVLDENQLYQARRHAERKRHLIRSTTLLGTDDLVALMPDRLSRDSNTARTLATLRDRGEVLGVKLKGDWRYPAAQFDRRGEVHAALVPVLMRARKQGYDGWETLHWLTTPRPVHLAPVVPGRPLEPSRDVRSLDDIAVAARARHEAEPPEADGPAVAPFALLAAGDMPAFERLARRWLGDPPGGE